MSILIPFSPSLPEKEDSFHPVQMSEVCILSCSGLWRGINFESLAKTYLTGSGLDSTVEYASDAEKKVAFLERFAPGKSSIVLFIKPLPADLIQHWR